MSSDGRIKIATSIPSLKNKIKTNISADSNSVYWYIRFNIPLNEHTVSEKTMGVTDTSGYIMRTDINYDEEKNMIVISPLDTYEENRFYILRISKKVRSKKGQKLRSNINILFKLMNTQISEFKVLKKEVRLADAKKRPDNYDQLYTRSRVYSIDGTIAQNTQADKLPYADLDINIWAGVAGILMLVVTSLLQNLTFIGVSVVICIAALCHILYQLNQYEFKSLRTYNKGAKKFNKEQYLDAKTFFVKALIQNDNNEYAEYARDKVDYYLS